MMTSLDRSRPDAPGTRDMRHAMVSSQLRPNGVNDTRLVAAMASIAREDFLPPEARALAYRDTAIPLGRNRAANPAMATGRLLTQAELTAHDRVLLIGANGGYTAAVLAALVAHVTAVEEDPALLAIARAGLRDTTAVQLVEGPLAAGAPADAPYDLLVVDGAVEELPATLLAQLAVGGRVVTGLIERGVFRLALGRKTANGFGLVAFADAESVPLPGFARPTGFRF